MTSPLEYWLFQITKHWDAKEELCESCQAWWEVLPHATRKEIRHNYEFEQEEG